MGENLISSLSAIALALVGLGVLATLVSKNANTTGVINAGARGFTSALTAAEGPVIGSSGFNNSNYQSAGYVID